MATTGGRLAFLVACLLAGLLVSDSARTIPVHVNIQASDASALLQLRASLNLSPSDSATPLAFWNSSSINCATWTKVTCDSAGYVIALNLSSLGLTVTLTPSISKLKHLQTLDVSNNSYIGNLPLAALGSMPNLVYLDLSADGVSSAATGNLTSLTGFPKLQHLTLRNQQLTGPLPASLGAIRTLTYLNLNSVTSTWNPLLPVTAGPIPLAMGNLANLQYLDLSSIGLVGSVPLIFGAMKQLRYLDLSFNYLNGSYTALLTQLSEITTLTNLLIGSQYTLKGEGELAGIVGEIYGVVPANLGETWLAMELLDFSYLGLQGQLSANVGNMRKLTTLNLQGNHLTGQVPDALGSCVELTSLVLNTNNFTGALPANLGEKWLAMQNLDFSGCGLQGQLSASIGNMQNLTALSLQDNRLTGEVPNAIGSCVQLTALNISNNGFTGPLPIDALDRLTKLESLDLSSNRLNGSVPVFGAASVPSVYSLVISNNQFQSVIPDSWGRNLPSLQTLDGHNNQLYGNIKVALISLQQLTYLDLSNNQLTGKLPTGWQSALNLLAPNTSSSPGGYFNVSSNYLWGSSLVQSSNGSAIVPPDAASGERLNCFTNEAGQRTKSACAAFCNATVGGGCQGTSFCIVQNGTAACRALGSSTPPPPTPNHPPPHAPPPPAAPLLPSPSSVAGSPPIPVSGPPPTQVGKSHSSSNTGAIAGGVAGGVAFLILLLALALFLITRRKQRTKKGKSLEMGDTKAGGPWKPKDVDGTYGSDPSGAVMAMRYGGRQFELAEIHAATNHFSDANMLKAGGYGTVYKGVAPDGRKWAVKRTHVITLESLRDFANEVEIISKMRHRNVVELLGHCQDNQEQILVYEYVPNGNLRQQLNCDPAWGGKPLTFDQRLEIAVGAARGIHYLHSFAKEPIIHRDIKSANLVLDENMQVKVTDFGLSKVLPAGPDGPDGPQHLSTRVAGTPGYLDPDYYRTFQVTTKSDVFSFGVVLFELITGRTAVMKDPSSLDAVALVRWAHPYLVNGNVADIVDPAMGPYSKEAMDLFCSVALLCVNPQGENRPTMLQVVRRLEEAQGATLKLPPSDHLTVPEDMWTGVVLPGLPTGDSGVSHPSSSGPGGGGSSSKSFTASVTSDEPEGPLSPVGAAEPTPGAPPPEGNRSVG